MVMVELLIMCLCDDGWTLDDVSVLENVYINNVSVWGKLDMNNVFMYEKHHVNYFCVGR